MDFRKVTVGQTINFAKDFNEPITGAVTFNLNWGKINGKSVDLDAFAFITRDTNQAMPDTRNWFQKLFNIKPPELRNLHATYETVYYGNLVSRGVLHHGDDLTGDDKEGEYITVDFDKLPSNVRSITFAVLSFSGHRFSDLPFSSVKIFTGTPNNQRKGLIEHTLAGFNFHTKTVVIAHLEKTDDGMWQVRPLKYESSSATSIGVGRVCQEAIK